MADEKATSNGNVSLWIIPTADVADYRSITASELNTDGINITEAVAWEGTTFPANSESNDIDDRSLNDRGNATTRGFAQFEATLSLFRPLPSDTTSIAAIAWAALKTPRTEWYLVTRVLQGTEGEQTPAVAGQWINVYKMLSDTVNDDTEGEDSYKYIIGFLPQGELSVNTQVKNASAVTIAPLTLSLAVGDSGVVRATLGGHRATSVVRWESSAPDIASVSQTGVVTGVSAGTANITASHPAATGASTPTVVTVT